MRKFLVNIFFDDSISLGHLKTFEYAMRRIINLISETSYIAIDF